jgi:hypothetical protein
MLTYSFHQFGNVKVEWPGKEAIAQPKGYAYIIFENELQVSYHDLRSFVKSTSEFAVLGEGRRC